jgi:hypothetical protein
MRKAEMEAHHDAYTAKEGDIRAMLADRNFAAVFRVCTDSFSHIVPAIQYRRREGIEPQTPKFLAFEAICKYAPPLFEHAVLDALSQYVASERVLTKAETGYLSMVQAAVEREEAARMLWNHLELQPGTPQRGIATILGCDGAEIDDIVSVWADLGVMTREAADGLHHLFLCPALNVEVDGLCPMCGVRGRGRKESFFKSVRCQKCGAEGFYHISFPDAR